MENCVVSKRRPRTLGQAKWLRKHSTKTEKIVWVYLQGRRFHGYKFRRQVPIGKYIADFYCAERMLIVELDGSVHELRKRHDQQRDAYLELHGYRVIRFSNDQILLCLSDVLEVLRITLNLVPLPQQRERVG